MDSVDGHRYNKELKKYQLKIMYSGDHPDGKIGDYQKTKNPNDLLMKR